MWMYNADASGEPLNCMSIYRTAGVGWGLGGEVVDISLQCKQPTCHILWKYDGESPFTPKLTLWKKKYKPHDYHQHYYTSSST